MRRMRWFLALAIGAALAAPAHSQAYPCAFQSHAVEPLHPAANQPFTVTVTVLASCPGLFPAETEANVVTVPIDCYCTIGTPPPPYLSTHVFQIDGLPAGLATVQFVDYFESPPETIHSFSFEIGPVLEIPAMAGGGLLLFALLLLISALVALGWQR
jgi:hypothetical protein